MVPLIVAGALLIGDLPSFVRGRLHLERAATTVAYAWYSVPPAIVVLLAGEPRAGVHSVPLLAVVLAAQFAGDLGSTLLGQWIAHGVPARALLRPMAWVFLVDCLLAPIGLLAAIVADGEGAAAVLLVLPLMLLVVVFARERTARISNVLELSSAYRGTALLLGDVIEADDTYTGSHSRAVVDLTTAVATNSACRSARAQQAELAALLHDVGKIAIPNGIINKPGKLTPEEWAIIETHTIEGQRLLHRVGGALSEIGDIVRACHERWDGAGYPDGTAGEDVPLVARIVVSLRRVQRDDDRPLVQQGAAAARGRSRSWSATRARSSTPPWWPRWCVPSGRAPSTTSSARSSWAQGRPGCRRAPSL